MHRSVSDAELLRSYSESRSQEAFTELVRRYVDLVYTSARRQVREPNLAEDVTQQVFLVLAGKARSLRTETVLGAWLLAVTRNESRNTLKRLARRQRHERSAAEMKIRETQNLQSQSGTDADARWDSLEPLLDEALAELSDGDRRAVVLRYFQNKSHREAADALGISELSMRQRVHRGVERMRAFFAGRGMSVTAGGLTAALTANAVAVAPAGLAQTVVSAHAAAATGAAAGGFTLQKGALVVMAKSNAITVAAVTLLLAAGGAAIWFAVAQLRQSNPTPQAQATTRATHPASNPVAAKNPPPPAEDPDFVIPATKGPRWKPGGHPMFLPISGLAYDDKRGTRDGFDHVAYIEAGNWVRYSDVELREGDNTVVMAIACDQRYAGKIISIHLDDPNGPVVGKLSVKGTPTAGTFEQQTTIIEGAKGRHDVYLTFNGGGFNIRSLKFTAGTRDATREITASSHSAASKGVGESGASVVGVGAEKWLRYDSIDFGQGVSAFLGEITYLQSSGGAMQVRIDAIDGPIIAQQTIDPTEAGGLITVTAQSAAKPVKDVHDVYLTFTGDEKIADLHWFRFSRPNTRPTSNPATQATTQPQPVPQFRRG
jgi:RNA polymerase sigma factor (sigma-70 family)